jgi:hypothetical protein
MFGPIRSLILAAALYLPLSFFVWFTFAQTLVMPVVAMAKAVLVNWLPNIFSGYQLNKYQIDWITRLPVDAATLAAAGGREVGTVLSVNPMIYGYGLPVIAGLALAAPLPIARRTLQILIGAAIVFVIQANGVIWEAIFKIAFQSGPEGTQLIADSNLNLEMIAFAYQFSYLIIPALLPIVAWCLMNRDFIERLIVVDRFEDIVDERENSSAVPSFLPDAPEAPAANSELAHRREGNTP